MRNLLITLCIVLFSNQCFAFDVTRHDITWTISGSPTCGTFVNGDPWCVGPVSITNISAAVGETLGGSQKNPVPESQQGYVDGAGLAVYNASLNVGLSLPLALAAGDNIVTTTTRTPDSNFSYLKKASVLTILSEAPPSGTFRPGYCDTSKTLFSSVGLDYTKLGKMTLTASAPSLSSVEDSISRLWLDHYPNYIGRFLHPSDNMPDYGAEMSTVISTASLTANGNYTDGEKSTTVINLIQLGIDFWSIAKSSRTHYMMNPAHMHGRKFPVIFAATMLESQAMIDTLAKAGSYVHTGTGASYGTYATDAIYFSEDQEYYYVTAGDVDVTTTGEAQYPPDDSYQNIHIGMPEWFHHNYTFRYKGNQNFLADGYRVIAVPSIRGQVLAALSMRVKTLWNNNAIFDYLDRHTAINALQAHSPTVTGEPTSVVTEAGWAYEMWAAHRASYSGTRYKVKAVTNE